MNQYKVVTEFESFLNDKKKLRVIKDEKPYRFIRLLPNEKPFEEDTLRRNMSENTYVLADVHIGDPLDNWKEKRDNIVKTINSIVKPIDHLLFLGDLSAHSNTANIADVFDFINQIQCKNLYLILGNNDQEEIKTYIRMGFKTVIDRFEWKEYLFTHMPEPVSDGMINIHGHIHEEFHYINIDWHNHINIWDREYRPRTIKELRHSFDAGHFKGVTIHGEKELKTHESEKYFEKSQNIDITKETMDYLMDYVMETKRSELPDEIFGVPEERKYPLDSEKHVRSAIKLFNHVNPKYEKELAKNIIAKMNEYQITDIEVGEKNRFGKYYKPTSVNESMIPSVNDERHVYLIAFSYDSFFGKAVKWKTKSIYNHSAIALEPSLSSCYSYLRDIPYVDGDNYIGTGKDGFYRESLQSILEKDKDATMKVISVEISKLQYNAIKTMIADQIENSDKSSYNFGSIVANALNIAKDKTNEQSMVCSEFVGFIMDRVKRPICNKPINLITPDDIAKADKTMKKVKCIYTGRVDEYKVGDNETITWSDTYEDAKVVADSLSKQESMDTFHGNYKNSPHIIHRTVMKVNDVPVAVIELYQFPKYDKDIAHICVMTHLKHRRHGYITKTFQKFMEDCNFKGTIIWNHVPNNIKSGMTADSLGFICADKPEKKGVVTWKYIKK